MGFALYFDNFSTFLGKPGINLEDLYVKPEMRGKGLGKALLAYLARLTIEQGGRTARVGRPHLEHPGPRVLRLHRCRPPGPAPREQDDRQGAGGDGKESLIGADAGSKTKALIFTTEAPDNGGFRREGLKPLFPHGKGAYLTVLDLEKIQLATYPILTIDDTTASLLAWT